MSHLNRQSTRHPRRAVVLAVATVAAVATLAGTTGLSAASANATRCSSLHKCATTVSLAPVAARQARAKPVTVTGTLRRSGGPVLTRRLVAVQYRVPGTHDWHTLGHGDRTDTRGRYEVKVPADRTYVLRAVFQPSVDAAFERSTSTARTFKVTYPDYVAPTLSPTLGACEVIHNGGESMDLKARFDIAWAGGVYQINQLWGPSTYHYAGQPRTTSQLLTYTNGLDDPDQTLSIDLTGAAYRPGLPGISSTYVEVGPVPFTYQQSDCVDVTKFTF